MAEIILKGVTKKYADDKVIGPIDITVADGDFAVLLGPTGSGKTAVLRLIAGLDDVSEGELTIDGKLANDLEPKDRNLTISMAGSRLFPMMNVYDNLAFGLKMRKVSPDDVNLRVREIARIFDLTDSLFKKPKSLTAQERQRVAIARSIVREPDAGLFDDPLAGLDDALTRNVRSDFAKIQYRFKSTFILTTRDQIDAMTLATKIIVMNDGKVEQVGTPKEIYCSPRTAFVARYVGSPTVNFAPAELKRNGEEYAVEIFGEAFTLSRERAEAIEGLSWYLSGSRGITAAIRPESVEIDAESPIKMKVDGVDNYGSHKVALVKTGSKPLAEWNVLVSAESEIKVGDELGIKIDPEKLMLFDRETEISVFEKASEKKE